MAPEGSNAQPYDGRESYIFISYAHRNGDEVLEIIGRMQAEGCRVWYNEGIDPDAEQAAHIAERLADCVYFIAFLSPEYLESADCLDELNFARDKEKNRLLVYLNNVTMPDGISMRVNRLQAIHKYVYGQEEFYERLFQAKGLKNCMSSSAPEPESAAPHVPASRPGPEEKTPESPCGQDTAKESAVAAHSVAVPGKRRKLLLLVPAAACILLAVLIPSVAGNDGTDGEAPPNANPAYSTASALIPGPADLNGLAFGMSPDEVREIMTTSGAAEIAAYYNPHGILCGEYDCGAGEFYGGDSESLLAAFNSDGLQQLSCRIPLNTEIPQALKDRYGEPDRVYTDHDEWDLGDDFLLLYYYYKDCNVISIGFIYGSYLDMRDFTWGMSPAEAQEAEAGRFDSLTLTESGTDSEGYPFQTYEGEWEILANPVEQVTLIYAAEQLAGMKYILTEASFDSVVADLTVLYGDGTDRNQNGSVISWEIMVRQPDGIEIPLSFSASRLKDGVLMTWKDRDHCQAPAGN